MTVSNRTCAAPRGPKRVITSVYLPEDLVRNLKKAALQEDRSVSSFITWRFADLRDPRPAGDPQPAEPSQVPQAA